ncbi:hypothetical protein RSOLAG22IIIB_13288 [Rhizoctonia solani]|uniref:Uncharacterized protein n=1 Tax=Rhizoctonia solani TaxID=456999 RepID=A0A0K6FMD6_9AGAM|nr:hypothetical protein RSOLAG22IIIB_13288 [Rhizoctonia solani]
MLEAKKGRGTLLAQDHHLPVALPCRPTILQSKNQVKSANHFSQSSTPTYELTEIARKKRIILRLWLRHRRRRNVPGSQAQMPVANPREAKRARLKPDEKSTGQDSSLDSPSGSDSQSDSESNASSEDEPKGKKKAKKNKRSKSKSKSVKPEKSNTEVKLKIKHDRGGGSTQAVPEREAHSTVVNYIRVVLFQLTGWKEMYDIQPSLEGVDDKGQPKVGNPPTATRSFGRA